jgi:hypothetical protein
MAPAGGVPVSRYFQNSTRSFLASATMPILRSRVPPCPNRRSYHWLSSFCGWYRSQPHAISMAIERIQRFPALQIVNHC